MIAIFLQVLVQLQVSSWDYHRLVFHVVCPASTAPSLHPLRADLVLWAQLTGRALFPPTRTPALLP